jgi:hypothetical protein
VKHRRKKTLGLCAIFKEVSATIRADRLDEVSQSLGTELHNENDAIVENLWNKLWRNLDGVLSKVKQFKQEENKYL